MAPNFTKRDSLFSKFDDEHRIAYGWAIVSTENSVPYFDLQGDHIPMDAIVAATIDFMKNSRASDDMHTETKTGDVVFCAPVTKGTVVDPQHPEREGLWIGVQIEDEAVYQSTKKGERRGFSIGGFLDDADYLAGPNKRKRHAKGLELVKLDRAHNGKIAKGEKPQRIFRSFRLGFISTVDWPAQEGALISLVKSASGKQSLIWLRKQVVLTSETDGHQHTIDLDDPADSWSEQLSTSYQTAEGADGQHCHAWVYDPTSGAVTIGTDGGHTHDVSDLVPTDVMARAAAREIDESDDAVPVAVPVEESSGSTINVVIAARDTAAKSTPPVVVTEPALTSKELPKMQLAKILAAILAATASQQGYLAKLAPDEVEPFFAKTPAEREAIMKAAIDADAPIFKGELTGVEVRKSDGALALQLAKQNEANAAANAKLQAEVTKAQLATEQVTLEKRADGELGAFAKSVQVRAAILKAIDAIADEAVRKEALEAVKAANVAMLELGKAIGLNPNTDAQNAETPLAKFNAKLAEFAKAKGVADPRLATSAFMATAEGSALYTAAVS